MKNTIFLIGRLTDEPEIKGEDNGKKYSSIVIAVNRDFKNSDGVYECDFIRCVLFDFVASNVKEYCHKGDLIGVKGRLQVRSYEENNETKFITEVIAEKITFLSSKKEVE